MNDNYNTSEEIRFKYKGRNVKGKVLAIQPKAILLQLMTDYIGKNVEWIEGEQKSFNKAEMKNIKVLPNDHQH